MRNFAPRTRLISATIATSCGLALAGWVSVLPSASSAALLNQVEGVRERDIYLALSSAGLTNESLAASGVTGPEATSVVAGVAAALGSDSEALEQSVAALGKARAAVEDLERSIRRGAGNEGAVNSLALARTTLASAQGQFDAFIESVRTSGISPLAPGKRSLLTALRPNLDRPVPVEFKVASRTDANWTALRDALANERQDAERGAALDPALQVLLEAVRDEAAVGQAQAALAQNLPALASAVQTAVATLGE